MIRMKVGGMFSAIALGVCIMHFMGNTPMSYMMGIEFIVGMVVFIYGFASKHS